VGSTFDRETSVMDRASFTLKLNEIICELSHLGIIGSNDLLLVGNTETESRNKVHDEKNEAGSEERVSKTSAATCELISELDIVVVQPSTRDHGEAIKMSYVVSSKESGQDVADETTNTMGSENIDGIIDIHIVLEFGSEIADDTSNDTEDN